MLREHQTEFDAICQSIRAGRRLTKILVGVTPGGGKSLLPQIAAKRLLPSVASKICWVVPRVTLREQGERDFLKPRLRALVGHQLTIRASTNDHNPTRGHCGYITTYDAIVADPTLHASEFAAHRYVLILDEPHHVRRGSIYEKAITPLMERAVLAVLMSGTWERGDGMPISFVPYVSDGRVLRMPDIDPNDYELPHTRITYTRRQALRDHAIKPLRFTPQNGSAEFLNRLGERRRVASLAASGDEAREAVFTALNTEFAAQLLERCTVDWQAYRHHHPSSKLLVVAATIQNAQQYLKQLRKMGISRVDIATSDDAPAALAAIDRYKRGSHEDGALDALVTVAMAYEGLDVPAITHLACLTHIRSRPWIEQMLGRGQRVDPDGGAYERQWGLIYGPDDPLLVQIMEAIHAEQEPFVRDRDWDGLGGDDSSLSGDGPHVPREEIVPLAGALTGARWWALDERGEKLDEEATARWDAVLRENGVAGILDPITASRIFVQLQATPTPAAATATATVEAPPVPPSVVETRLRSDIAHHIGAYEKRNSIPFGTVNKELIRLFDKPRDQMTEKELLEVWQWVRQHYPAS